MNCPKDGSAMQKTDHGWVCSLCGFMSPDSAAEVPHGWNWGAFWLTWIWGAGNSVWISFLAFVPIVNLAMPFVLGSKGTKWAWEAGGNNDVVKFRRHQRMWAIAGWLTALVVTVLSVIIGIVIAHFHISVHQLNDQKSPTVSIKFWQYANYHQHIDSALSKETNHDAAGLKSEAQSALSLAQVPAERSYATYLIGLAAMRKGGNATARTTETQAMDIDATLPQPYNTLAEIAENEGSYTAAVALEEQCIGVDARFEQAYLVKGQALYEMGQRQAAIDFATAAVKMFPDNKDLADELTGVTRGDKFEHFRLTY